MKDVLVEITDAELDEILGAGDGVMYTLTHECHMNTWQFLLTCYCSRSCFGSKRMGFFG